MLRVWDLNKPLTLSASNTDTCLSKHHQQVYKEYSNLKCALREQSLEMHKADLNDTVWDRISPAAVSLIIRAFMCPELWDYKLYSLEGKRRKTEPAASALNLCNVDLLSFL